MVNECHNIIILRSIGERVHLVCYLDVKTVSVIMVVILNLVIIIFI